ncbi:MAG: hypothetical protein ABSG97_04685 [Sedimentisphaerales bacterium]|jgi:hypothetical protein
MRKLLAGLAVLAVVLSVCALSYGAKNTGHYVLVYKGTISAAKTIFDVNDTNNLLAGSIQGFWAVDINGSGTTGKGAVLDSNSVLYTLKDKEYTVIPNAIEINPHDPCRVELLTFSAEDADGGGFDFDVVGKGQSINIYDANKHDPNTLVKKFAPMSMKGGGFSTAFSFFDADEALSGTYAVTMTLDPTLTKHANHDGNNVDGVTNSFISKLNKKGDFTKFHQSPAPD